MMWNMSTKPTAAPCSHRTSGHLVPTGQEVPLPRMWLGDGNLGDEGSAFGNQKTLLLAIPNMPFVDILSWLSTMSNSRVHRGRRRSEGTRPSQGPQQCADHHRAGTIAEKSACTSCDDTPGPGCSALGHARCGFWCAPHLMTWWPSCVSEEGHLITCAHFLTGSSWMEGEPEAAKVDHGSGTQHGQLPAETARAPPRRSRQPTSCSGRGKVRNPDGQVVEITFEADVLHIFEGYLDAALLRARLPLNTTTFWSSSAAHPDAMFMPLPWCSASSVPKAGLEVLAVGHGLFGPGTPWTGPAISTGHLCKVSHGTMTRRPAVLQSTTAVHRGCSGGALVATESGTFIGLVTTNVKHQDGTTMPRVNFSLPTMRLAPAFADFLKHGADDDALQQLVRAWGDCGADAQERGLWRLEPEPLWLPSRMEDRKKQALDRMKQLAADAEAAAASQDEDSTESSIATSSIKDSGNEDQSNPARPSAEAVASAHRWRRSRL